MSARRIALLAGVAFAAALAGCEQEQAPPPPPTAAEVAGYYPVKGGSRVDVRGNVATVDVVQPADQLRRGGALWAKVGPYVYLFTPGTKELFTEHPGLAAVRVVVRTPDGREVARALLERTTLNAITWNKALLVAGKARTRGTDRPGLLYDLVRYGEEHTEYDYNPSFVRAE